MKRFILLVLVCRCFITPVFSQHLVSSATSFINLLDSTQRSKTLYPFDTEERYRFNYVPLGDRKGISINELNSMQYNALMELLNNCVTKETISKINDIRRLDNVLKEIEHRQPGDNFRDTGKYMVTIFGIPSANTTWGWRFEGHHVAFHFSANKNQLVSGTPGFLGTNPAIVLSGPQKDKQVLKEETIKGFAFLHALSADEFKKAVIDSLTPKEIITGASRKAMIEHPAGIRYSELSTVNQQQLLQLVNLYIHRYTKLFAETMLKEIQAAGLENLWFSWAGYTQQEFGKACYYRIQGPTIIIEYDNFQNNANHIHTVIRDLNNDFGGDILLEHYRESH
ncbi:DUF3500 domain-containing protein [soil metagenome]